MKTSRFRRWLFDILRLLAFLALRIRCIFGFHADPIGGIDIVEYEPVVMFRYRSYLKCPVCHKEIPDTKGLPQ